MAKFSIKDIEAVSGIKSHTLRIWELRYNILTPKRTDTNIRYYDDEDLKSILNISILNKHGFKISEISKLSKEEINTHILKIAGHSNVFDAQVKGLLGAMLSFDEPSFHTILTTSIIQIGLEQTMMSIVYPFLSEVGVLWQVGSLHPSHEHFASGIIKQKLYATIDSYIGHYSKSKKRFLLFLPENEKHSLGLLFANFLIRARGHEVIYLGQEVPLKDFKNALSNHKPDYIFTILTAAHINVEKQELVNLLANVWSDSQILLSGVQFTSADLIYPDNVKVIKTMSSFIQLVNGIENDTVVN